MSYQLLVIIHLLGASVWIGGHAVLLGAVLPRAFRERSASRVREFETAFGPLGLGALATQIASGLALANKWLGGDWAGLFGEPTPTGHLILTKLALLALIFVIGAHATHRVLPRMRDDRLLPFTLHAVVATVLSIGLLIAGAGIRTGGFG